jgi:hypothetical protein
MQQIANLEMPLLALALKLVESTPGLVSTMRWLTFH